MIRGLVISLIGLVLAVSIAFADCCITTTSGYEPLQPGFVTEGDCYGDEGRVVNGSCKDNDSCDVGCCVSFRKCNIMPRIVCETHSAWWFNEEIVDEVVC